MMQKTVNSVTEFPPVGSVQSLWAVISHSEEKPP